MAIPLLATMSVISAQASTITVSDLPASIQSCSPCSVNLTSVVDLYLPASGGGMSLFAFNHTQVSGGPLVQDWLVRYSLGPSSAQSTIYLNAPYNQSNHTDQLAGNLWMSVQNQYSPTDAASHPFVLYVDKISPIPDDYNFYYSDIPLTMPVADILAGSSFYSGGQTTSCQTYSSGNLAGALPMPPADCGVYAAAQLDLVGLTFQNYGSYIGFSGVNSSDTRSLVFTQSSGEHANFQGDYDSVQTYNISSVPLPGALWLFGSGLLGLVSIMRRGERQG
jgi:hypothetical protein